MDNMPEKNLADWAEQGGPPRIKAGLASLFSVPAVSRAMDEQVLGAVGRQAIGRNRMRWVIRYAIGSVAAAAAVILIAIKLTHHQQPAVNYSGAVVASAEDV